MQCLENVRYSGKLSVALAKRIDEEMKIEEKQPALMASLVRALSGNEASSERKRQIREILSSDSRKEVEVLPNRSVDLIKRIGSFMGGVIS